jgi:drug/metabolite transporter (DMT)-like permease
MTPVILGLGLAVVGSVALNGSYLLQHAGSRAVPAIALLRPVSTLAGLLRSRWWLVGAGLGLLGSVLHVAALAHAPLSLVQAFAAGGLALTVPVAARAFGERLERLELLAVGLLIAGLAALGVGARTLVADAVPARALTLAVVIAALTAGALAMLRPGRRRAHLLGAAGGVLYGASDAATKAVTMTHGGLIAAVISPWMGVVVVLCVAAFACFQRGLQIGPAVPVIALMTGATNAVAILLGLVVFDEPLGATPVFAGIHAVALASALAAGLALVSAQGRLAPATAPRRPGRRRTLRSPAHQAHSVAPAPVPPC